MSDVLDRLKILIDSSTPIIVMETVGEMRAVHLVPLSTTRAEDIQSQRVWARQRAVPASAAEVRRETA